MEGELNNNSTNTKKMSKMLNKLKIKYKKKKKVIIIL